MALEILPDLSLDEGELEFRTSTSQGPGGQHVNRTETRVTLLFDVVGSPSLDEPRRQRILSRLATRINREGVLRVSSQRHRSQSANREATVARFVTLLREALHEEPARRATRPTRASRKRRLDEKKRRSRTKQLRRTPTDD
jgi:ribosome-associated protein